MAAAAKRVSVSSIAPPWRKAANTALALLVSTSFCLSTLGSAEAATPKIRTSPQNAVPACVTPQRLMAFLKLRNSNLAPRFAAIADWYKLHGEAWHVRWDYAFFQMAVETNFLTFKRGDGSWGDARPNQNNFAGLGTTGGGVPGDSYPDVSTGVLAQIQHLVVYSGQRIPNPVGARTKLKQDDIIEATASKKGRMTFADLARRWAADKHYGAAIEWVAGNYRKNFCSGTAANDAAPQQPPAAPLPRATALGGPAAPNPGKVAVKKVAPARTIWSREMQAKARVAKPELPQTAEAPAKAAEEIAHETAPAPAAPPAPEPEPMIAAPEPALPATVVTALAETTEPGDSSLQAFAFAGRLRVASASQARTDQTAARTCSVVAASYGGEKTLLVRGTEPTGEVRYTVLTVLAGFEQSMLDNYINAHAPGGASLGEFESRDEALAKATELCPSAAQTMHATSARAG